jgi:hypothetical protein
VDKTFLFKKLPYFDFKRYQEVDFNLPTKMNENINSSFEL